MVLHDVLICLLKVATQKTQLFELGTIFGGCPVTDDEFDYLVEE